VGLPRGMIRVLTNPDRERRHRTVPVIGCAQATAALPSLPYLQSGEQAHSAAAIIFRSRAGLAKDMLIWRDVAAR
jgi:hypothetical protein